MRDFIITNGGRKLTARLIRGETTANFSKAAASDYNYCDYSEEEIEALTELQGIKKEVLPSELAAEDETSIRAIAVFDNADIDQRIYIRAIGLYAEEPDGTETLYAVSICDEEVDSLPPFGGKTVSSLTYDMHIRVDRTEQMTLELNPTAYATIETLTRMIEETKELENEKIDRLNEEIENINSSINGLSFGISENNCLTVTYDDGTE